MAMGAPFAITEIINDRWRVVKFRQPQETTFTWQYVARDLNTGELVNFTVAPTLAQHGFPNPEDHKRALKLNAMIVKELGMHGSPVPEFISYGESGQFNYMCTEMVGPSLKWIRENANAASFSLTTALNLGMDMLVAIREGHESGYLLRHVAPEKFVLPRNLTTSAGLLFVVDAFLMARRYVSITDDVVSLPLRPTTAFRGNLLFSSVSALRFLDQTRMDDVWQWFYLVVHFVKGDLGWPPLQGANVHEQLAAMANAKEDLHNRPHEWLGAVPNELYQILEYLKTAPRETPPDYLKLFRLIKNARINAIESLGGVAPPLDWEPGGQWYGVLDPLMQAYMKAE